MLVVGCSSADEITTDQAGEVERLEAEVSALEQELALAAETVASQGEALEEARVAAESAAAREPGPCCEELARCCGMTIGPPNQVVAGQPIIWFPPHSGYHTEAEAITVEIIASDGADVSVNGLVPVVDDRAGPESTYSIDLSLDEGPNRLDIAIDDKNVSWSVVRDSSLNRAYGRVLDPRRDALGIDYGEMDLEPAYGQGDFDPGVVVVEFADVAASTNVITTSPYTSRVIITGQQAIFGFYHNDSAPTEVWSVLLRGNEIVHLEGPMPLGD